MQPLPVFGSLGSLQQHSRGKTLNGVRRYVAGAQRNETTERLQGHGPKHSTVPSISTGLSLNALGSRTGNIESRRKITSRIEEFWKTEKFSAVVQTGSGSECGSGTGLQWR